MAFYDCIAAISTPPGKGGVSVIRISGDGALAIAEAVFFPKSGKRLGEHPSRMQVYGDIRRGGEHIDDGLATLFKAGASYTGEETVEISCHGGILVTKCVLEAIFAAGARPAEAGEFTKRAFINGKLSLTDAEAIGNLLDAKTEEQIKLAGSESRNKLNMKIGEIKHRLTEILSSAYARIDYPDEDLGDFSDEELSERLMAARGELVSLLATYRTGRAVNEGINTVICGKPNVGKSTLYNLLCGEDAAIVTDIGGTTRDVLERAISLGRVMLNIADTAGIRESLDTVEKIGIERSRKRIEDAELVFAVFDVSRPLDSEDDEILKALEGTQSTKIAILNKSDAEAPSFDEEKISAAFSHIVKISAKVRESDAICALRELTDALFTDGDISIGHDAVVSSARQSASLISAKEFLDTATDALNIGISQDAVSSDIERALGALSEVDGREVSESIVADIFNKFCVGK